MEARDAYTPGVVGEVIVAMERWFGEEYPLLMGDGLVHLCMVIGQRTQGTRALRAPCGVFNERGTVAPFPTCLACVGHVYEEQLPW